MSTHTKVNIDAALASIGGKEREINHKVLQPILVDLIALSLTLKQLHWNVVGPSFRTIHLHLDEIYASVLEAIDTVAERLTATGHSPTGTPNVVAKETELKAPPEGFLQSDEVLLLASQSLREAVGLIRDRMAQIEEADTVTADLLHQIVGSLEKHHWMLQAQRS